MELSVHDYLLIIGKLRVDLEVAARTIELQKLKIAELEGKT